MKDLKRVWIGLVLAFAGLFFAVPVALKPGKGV